jgi:DNA-binding CsgD family transcriptional regulator
MNEAHIPQAANEPDRSGPAWTVLTRLAGWIRSRLGRRIWIVLPGQGPETGQTLVLPLSLAHLLHQRARETDWPVEALLRTLLRTALLEQRPPDPVELVWRSLTEREREVACLMAAGLSNRQIAARLTISRNTVRTHARQIVRKFGCPNRKGLPELKAYCPQQE